MNDEGEIIYKSHAPDCIDHEDNAHHKRRHLREMPAADKQSDKRSNERSDEQSDDQSDSSWETIEDTEEGTSPNGVYAPTFTSVDRLTNEFFSLLQEQKAK